MPKAKFNNTTTKSVPIDNRDINDNRKKLERKASTNRDIDMTKKTTGATDNN